MTWKQLLNKPISLKGRLIIVLIFFILPSVIYMVIDDKKSDEALKDAAIVKAKVKAINPARGNWSLLFEYRYKNKLYDYDYLVSNIDTFKKGQVIFLKISKRYPDEYVDLNYKTAPDK